MSVVQSAGFPRGPLQQPVFWLGALLLVLIFAGLTWNAIRADQQALSARFRNEGEQLRAGFELAQRMTEQNMLQLATMVAADPVHQRLFLEGKRAVDAEGGGPGGARAAAARERLYRHVETVWLKMQDEFKLRQLHFHLAPGSLSFLRVHTPRQFGDRMDRLRHIIVDVNRDQRPRSGFETGRIYSGLRGVVPVFALDGSGRRVHVGALEAGTSFDTQLASLDTQLGAGIAVLLKKEHVEQSVWRQFLSLNGLQTSECQCYVEAASRPEITALLRAGVVPRLGDSGDNLHLQFEHEGKTYNAIRFALHDYLAMRDGSRERVGSVLMWVDRSAEVAALKQRTGQRVAYAMLAAAVTLALLYFSVAAATRHLVRRAEAIAGELVRERNIRASLVEVLPQALLMTDAQGRILDVNRTFCEITGYGRDEVIGRRAGLLGAGHTPPEVYQELWRTVLAGKVWKGELLNRRKDGAEYWDAVAISPVLDQSGKVRYFVSLQSDVTARRQAEEALRESRASLTNAQRIARIGNWDWDIRHGTLSWSEEIYRIFGFAPGDQPTYERFIATIPEPDRSQVEAAVARALAGEGDYRAEHRILRPDGSERVVAETGEVRFGGDGKPEHMVGTVQDITERKQHELAMRTAQQRLASLIENLHGGILVEDEDRRIVLANQSFCDIFGIPFPPESLVGADCVGAAEQAKGLFTEPTRFIERIREILAQRRVVAGEEWATVDGRILERSYVPIFVGETHYGHLWQYWDVTDRKRAEEELRRLATTDPLTGLPNRRALLKRAQQELARVNRTRRHSGLLMVDIDHFKMVNDRFGHAAGDAALVRLAHTLNETLRDMDTAGRMGGEEFAVVLPETSEAEAFEVAERLRATVAGQAPAPGEEPLSLTISIGVTTFDPDDERVEDVLARADAALYRAKNEGRNRVCG